MKFHTLSTGVENGLRLTLNVEQYEYMPGPHDAAGLKMLLHDVRELPSVHGLGQAVATGTHGFAGVRFMQVSASYGIDIPRFVLYEEIMLEFFR